MFAVGELCVDGILSEVAFDLNEVLHCDAPCVCSRPVRDILLEGRGTCELPRAPGVKARAKRKSFWKGTRSERGGRSPKPRRGESFHCGAAGRERSEVPRFVCTGENRRRNEEPGIEGQSKDERPERSVWYARERFVSETEKRAKRWRLVRGSTGALALRPPHSRYRCRVGRIGSRQSPRHRGRGRTSRLEVTRLEAMRQGLTKREIDKIGICV